MDWCYSARIVYSDVRHNFLLHYLLAAAVVFITPLFFSVSGLDSRQAAQPLEMIISLTGTVLLTPVFMPEQNGSIRDVIRSKKTPYLLTCIVRLCIDMLILAALAGISVLYMKKCRSEVTFLHFAGTAASAMALGSLGFFAAGLSNNVIIGYMASLLWYIINFTAKDKLGVFFIFSMMNGSFDEKKWLLALSFALILLTFVYLSYVKYKI
ncbi:MAG: hypothetical protein GXY08_04830 [Ruminococcus sp.]|mgnify:CR=1 FL=1|nr:hypothetical protein [Ruminococcus sp.]